MTSFTTSALLGLCIGFFWGTGCSLAILYSIYLGGYRKAVKDSLAPQKSERYTRTLARIKADQDKAGEDRRSAEQP
jgi:hypothetical protein